MINFDKIEAIIFDLDGTLSDTMPIHYKAFCSAFKKYEITDFSEKLFYDLAGVPADKITKMVLDKHKLKVSAMQVADEKDALFHKYSSDIRPIKKVIDIADKYKASKKMAVATGSIRWSAEESLAKLKIRDWFSVVICSDDILKPKPDPEIFLKAAKQLDVDPQKCVVIEDSPLGIQGAKSAGMLAIHIDEIPNS